LRCTRCYVRSRSRPVWWVGGRGGRFLATLLRKVARESPPPAPFSSLHRADQIPSRAPGPGPGLTRPALGQRSLASLHPWPDVEVSSPPPVSPCPSPQSCLAASPRLARSAVLRQSPQSCPSAPSGRPSSPGPAPPIHLALPSPRPRSSPRPRLAAPRLRRGGPQRQRPTGALARSAKRTGAAGHNARHLPALWATALGDSLPCVLVGRKVDRVPLWYPWFGLTRGLRTVRRGGDEAVDLEFSGPDGPDVPVRDHHASARPAVRPG